VVAISEQGAFQCTTEQSDWSKWWRRRTGATVWDACSTSACAAGCLCWGDWLPDPAVPRAGHAAVHEESATDVPWPNLWYAGVLATP